MLVGVIAGATLPTFPINLTKSANWSYIQTKLKHTCVFTSANDTSLLKKTHLMLVFELCWDCKLFFILHISYSNIEFWEYWTARTVNFFRRLIFCQATYCTKVNDIVSLAQLHRLFSPTPNRPTSPSPICLTIAVALHIGFHSSH